MYIVDIKWLVNSDKTYVERPLSITLKVVRVDYNEMLPFKVKELICGYGCGKFNYLGGFLSP